MATSSAARVSGDSGGSTRAGETYERRPGSRWASSLNRPTTLRTWTRANSPTRRRRSAGSRRPPVRCVHSTVPTVLVAFMALPRLNGLTPTLPRRRRARPGQMTRTQWSSPCRPPQRDRGPDQEHRAEQERRREGSARVRREPGARGDDSSDEEADSGDDTDPPEPAPRHLPEEDRQAQSEEGRSVEHVEEAAQGLLDP